MDAQVVLARVASVSGRVSLSSGNGASAVALAPGNELSPGDRVDTRGGGQIVIELTDGSMIVVQPESVIVIKDFRAAVSLRELFEIMLGSVRVKINHFGGRPNPYRINSPTASIAVRGTDFSITVDSQGATQVMVYEGSVEVTSLIDPSQSVVIEAGRGVLLVPGQGFQLFNMLPGREIAENQGNGHGSGTSSTSQMDERDWDSPRNIASIYEQYIAGLSEIGQVPFLLRYNAFPEAHLDSLENPAYATGFTAAEGRVVLLPSLNGTGGLDENPTPPGLSAVSPLNYSAASQFSMFVPLARVCDRRERHRIENWKWRARRTFRSRLVEHLEPDGTPGKLTNQRFVNRRVLLWFFPDRSPIWREHQFWGRNREPAGQRLTGGTDSFHGAVERLHRTYKLRLNDLAEAHYRRR